MKPLEFAGRSREDLQEFPAWFAERSALSYSKCKWAICLKISNQCLQWVKVCMKSVSTLKARGA